MNSFVLRLIVVVCTTWLAGVSQVNAQCTELPRVIQTPQPSRCQTAPSAGNIVPYFSQCRTVCLNNTGTGPSNQVSNKSCVGGTQPANDLYLYANNPYAQIPGYDGSLVFRWVDWPGKAQGVFPPYFAVHGEVRAQLGAITAQSIDCTDGFALENAICLDPADTEGNQFFAPPGTIPTLAQLDPIVDAIAGVNVSTTDVSFWINIATSNGAQGPICYEVSPYKSGYLCGDATTVALTGTGSTRSGTAPQQCLCGSALYGGIGNVNNGFTPPCGTESSSAAWYKINVPFGCNNITASLSNWGGAGQYNIAILSGVSCPANAGTNPITGAAVTTPNQTLDPGAVIVGSGCTGPASTACTPVPAGEYYIVVSGVTERPTFTLNVTVQDASVTVGTASSAQNGGNICSAGTVVVGTTGTVLPASGSCGQNIAWFYSTNLAFNPYQGAGTYAASGTSNVNIPLPANTTCQPRTYYIKGVVSDNGITAVAGCKGTTNTISVTVYPEIGSITVNNVQCLITVATRCASFTVNGNPGINTFIASFADDGLVKDFLVSNGLPACDVLIQDTVSCSGNCTQPTVSGVSKCDPNDPFNFYVDVTVAPGSAATYFIEDSDGGAKAVTSAGTYTVGPFGNGSSTFINLTNTDDAACNLPVGNFSDDCNNVVCPNLTNASTNTNGDRCEGAQTILQAFVDRGTLGTDYRVEWFKDGVPIPNSNSLSVIHTFSTTQGCGAEAQEFTIRLTCLLPTGSPSTTNFLTAGTVVVYPKPDAGIDFTQDPANCTLAPIDACGSLSISYSPTTNPAPGAAPTSVNYTIAVPGAPSGCSATGTYVVNCPAASCTNSAGEGVALQDDVLCFGENFTVASSNANLDKGYALGWAVTQTNPYGNLNQAVSSAISTNSFFGQDTVGNQSFNFTNGTQYGPGQYYFVPFVAMRNINAANPVVVISGTLAAPIFGAVVSTTITVPNIPYCSGLTAFDINFVANRASGVGNPIDAVSGLVTYSGAATANVNLNNNNFTGNPSGQTVTLRGSSTFGANINYTLTIRYRSSITYPTICPSCNDVGTPVAVNLLPDVQLGAIAPQTACNGATVNLVNLNPTANVAGSYRWYDGNPTAGGNVITDPTSVSLTAPTTFFVQFLPFADSTCGKTTSVAYTLTPKPVLNTIPAQAPICFGASVNLTALNSSVTSAAGTFTWFIGDPDSNGIRLPNAFAQNLAPVNGRNYFVVFTDNSTGCSNKTSVTYTVNPLPSLAAVPDPKLCTGDSYDLTAIEQDFTAAPGTFTWYNGDPNNGGVAITPTQAANVTPANGDTYFVVFLDQATGCTATGNISFIVNPFPTLVAPVVAPLCAGETIDLTSLEQGITSDPGTFVWYLGNPNTGGVQLNLGQAQAQTPTNGAVYFATFTNIITTCAATTSFTVTVNPKPSLSQVTPVTCAGTPVDLASLESDLLNGATGTFTYYLGNPDTGGLVLTPSQVSAQLPTGNETYFVVYTSTQNCTDTASFDFTVNATPVLNAIAPLGLQCAGFSTSLTALQAGITATAGTFTWYLGSPDTGSVVANPSAIVPVSGDEYFAVFTESANGCSAQVSTSFDVAAPVANNGVSYDCIANVLVVSLTGTTGGAGGYSVSSSSPNNAGDVLTPGTTYTVIITDTIGCTDTITGTQSCIICDAGDAGTIANNVFCCNDTAFISNSGPTLDVARVVAWGLTPQADGPITDSASALSATDVFRSNADGSLSFDAGCSDYPAGNYFLTPFISIKPNDNVPILWDPANGCNPVAEICPTISGTGWVLNPMIITFPDGTTYNVNQEIAFGLPIDQALLDAATGGSLPCIKITDLYTGDPNGTWSVSITNTGTGAITFTVPQFNVVVEADSCSLLTTDQVYSVPTIAGTISAGATNNVDFDLPPTSLTAPPVTYNPAAGCNPIAEICPTLVGTGWVLNPMIITFPDGSTYNVNQEIAFGLPIDQALLDAATGGVLPCINLTDLYTGDPNGTWTVSITNTGTGAITFTIPPFNIVVDSDSCTLLTQDEITPMASVTGTVQPNGGSASVLINIPPPVRDFPTIDSRCEDYGTPAEIVILSPISYASATATCLDTATGDFKLVVKGLTGGAPEVFTAESYVFSEAATYDATNDEYTVNVPGNTSFPYTLTVGNDGLSAGGTNCSANIVVNGTPCTVGIDEVASAMFVSIYPNPSNGKFTIKATLPEAGNISIKVLNMLGQEIMNQEVYSTVADFNTTVDLTEAAEGTYFIYLQSGDHQVMRRVVKQ